MTPIGALPVTVDLLSDHNSGDRKSIEGHNLPDSARSCRESVTIRLPGFRTSRTGGSSQVPGGGLPSYDNRNNRDHHRGASCMCSPARRLDSYAFRRCSLLGTSGLTGRDASRCSPLDKGGCQQRPEVYRGNSHRRHVSGACCAFRRCSPLRMGDGAWYDGGRCNLRDKADSYTYPMTSYRGR